MKFEAEIPNASKTMPLQIRKNGRLLAEGIDSAVKFREKWWPQEILFDQYPKTGQNQCAYRFNIDSGVTQTTQAQSSRGCKRLTVHLIVGHMTSAATVTAKLFTGYRFGPVNGDSITTTGFNPLMKKLVATATVTVPGTTVSASSSTTKNYAFEDARYAFAKMADTDEIGDYWRIEIDSSLDQVDVTVWVEED